MNHTCTNCHVTSSEDIKVHTDLEAIKRNERQRVIYYEDCKLFDLKAMEHHNKVSTYQRIVECHNKHKHFWQDKWIVHTFGNSETCIYLDDGWLCYEASSKYPKICRPIYPHLSKEPTHYIQCPVCNHKHYIEVKL